MGRSSTRALGATAVLTVATVLLAGCGSLEGAWGGSSTQAAAEPSSTDGTVSELGERRTSPAPSSTGVAGAGAGAAGVVTSFMLELDHRAGWNHVSIERPRPAQDSASARSCRSAASAA